MLWFIVDDGTPVDFGQEHSAIATASLQKRLDILKDPDAGPWPPSGAKAKEQLPATPPALTEEGSGQMETAMEVGEGSNTKKRKRTSPVVQPVAKKPLEDNTFRTRQRMVKADLERSRRSAEGQTLDLTAPGQTSQLSTTGASESHQRMVIVNDQGDWAFASAQDLSEPIDGYLLPLISTQWQRGNPIAPFVQNPVIGDRYIDWRNYVEDLDMHLRLRGQASQWQMALFVGSALGKVVSDLVRENKWIPQHPVEGVRHFDEVMKKLDAYFAQFSNIDVAHEKLMSAEQGANESISDFYNRIVKLAKVCQLPDNNVLIRTALIRGIKDKGLKEQTSFYQMTVEQILTAGIQRECRSQQEKQLKRPMAVTQQVAAVSEVATVSGQSGAQRGQPQKPSARPQSKGSGGSAQRQQPTSGWQQNKSSSTSARPPASGPSTSGSGRTARPYKFIPGPCRACGEQHKENNVCFGANKTCHLCGVYGHLQRVCPRSKSIHEVTGHVEHQQ